MHGTTVKKENKNGLFKISYYEDCCLLGNDKLVERYKRLLGAFYFHIP
jgi:hypothetical protein